MLKSPMVSIKNLSVRQAKNSRDILNQINLDIFPEEVVGLIGLSGCGKSTLAKTLVGLTSITEGEIEFGNQILVSKKTKYESKFRKEVQIVFQDPSACLNPRMSVLSILLEPLQIHESHLSKVEKILIACEMLEEVGLGREYLKRYPHELSGGQKQRVCIARSLILKPKFLIFDEAVSALDASIQAQILNLLRKLKKDFGFTLLFISHDLPIIHYISDKIAVMVDGRIVEFGTPHEIFNHAKHPFTRRLIDLSKKYVN